MKPLKKLSALLVLIVGIFAFTSKTNTTENSKLDLSNINILEELSEQNLSCRPTSDYVFFVETELQEKLRGANAIEAKIHILEKSTGKSNVISSESIIVPKFNGAVLLDPAEKQLENGDKIIKSETSYSLKELMKYETIHNSYVKSTNELLDLKRSI